MCMKQPQPSLPRLLGPVLAAVLIGACASDATEPSHPDHIEMALALSPDDLAVPSGEGAAVRVGIFLATSHGAVAPSIESVTEAAGALARGTAGVLEQCGMHLEVESVQVVRLPARLLNIQGNHRGSWGGHPPDSVGDPDRFMYEENERLTDETRELFAYGKEHTSPNAIAAFTVTSIEYYIGHVRTGAGGLSFPPVVYHHVDDYPLRNSVLLREFGSGRVPEVSPRVFAHELGHMLLNTGIHSGEPSNLMISGTDLTGEQCARMEGNLERLYGDTTVPDPGPP